MLIINKKFTELDIQPNIKLSRSINPPQFIDTSNSIKWKHLHHTREPSQVFFSVDDSNNLVGRFFFQPRLYYVSQNNLYLNSGIITDFAILPNIRNPLLMIQMVKNFSKIGIDKPVFHGSNKLSNDIYQNIFKFKKICEINYSFFLIKFRSRIKFISFTSNIFLLPIIFLIYIISFIVVKLSGYKTNIKPSEKDFHRIINDFKCIAGNHFSRDTEFHKWQYSSESPQNTKIYWIWRKGKCFGYFVVKNKQIFALELWVIIDFVFATNLSKLQAIALKCLFIKECFKHGSDGVVLAGNFSNQLLSWMKGFPYIYFKRLAKFPPQKVYGHIYQDIGHHLNYNNLFFTLIDLD